jgi:hypothetical protein
VHGEGAQASWADHQQVDPPVTLGPFVVTPGVYSAHLSFDPPLAPGMTAGNLNTGMSVVFAPMGAPAAYAGGATSLSVNMDGKTRDRSAEFTISEPGQIWVTFSPATSWGHAGGRRYLPQSYQGRVSLAKHLAELRAFRGMELHPGDTLRAGNSAVVAQGNGVMMVLQPGAEFRIDRMPDGHGLCAERLRGEIRFWATGWSPKGIEFIDGKRTIKVKGTDFVLKDSGVEVISGRVEVSGEDETVTLQAGQKLDYRNGTVEQFDAAALGPPLAADGIPADPEYWFEPSAEPFGKKELSMAGGVLDDGWLLADPPVRRGPRVEVESPASGVLRVTAPGDSALACGHYAADTAPRLLHRATGDFDLQALVMMEGQPGYGANLGFLVRAPGAYPGLVATRTHGQRSGDFALPRGVGRSYWRPGDALAMFGGSIRLPLLNTGSGSWLAAGDAPVWVRLSRRQDVWTTAWSRDGREWQISTVHVADLPETLWAGWSFENYSFGRPHGPAAFTLRDVSLQTSPPGTLDRDWGLFSQHGAAQTAGASVHLSLDGSGPGTARAFSPDCAEGDFDIAVTVDAPMSEVPPGDHVCGWSVVAASNVEQTVGLMAEVRQQGARYGLTRDNSPGHRAPVADYWIPESHLVGATDNRTFRVRLRRTDGRVTAHFWSDGEWKPARPDHPGRLLEGPVFLRLEAYNGDARTKVLAPMNVTFTVEASGAASVASPTMHPVPSDKGPREHEVEAPAHAVNVPAGTVKVRQLRDGRPRSVGLRVASGDFDEALARGVEAPVGVVITHVAPNSTAAAAGFRVNDVIEQMGDRKLENIEDFEATLLTVEPDSRQAVILVRGRQRGTLQLPITLADPPAPAFLSYTVPGGGYQFDYFPDWKLAPGPLREEVTGRVYYYLQSTDDNYRLYLYADSEPAANAVESLEAFRRQTGEAFLHGKSGWVLFGDIPAVFASGVVGRERLFTLYRLALVVDARRYEVNLFTPPKNDPARLPFVMETILGTLRRPDPTRHGGPEPDPAIAGAPAPPPDITHRPTPSPPAVALPSPAVPRAELDALAAQLQAIDAEVERTLGIRPPPPRPPVETRPSPPSKLAPMPSVTQIEQLRKNAVEVWSPPVDVGDDQDFQFPEQDPEPAPAGWAKSEHDPNKLVDLFKPLRLRKGYVLRAYIFRENGNASGVVWAMPENAEFPEPKDSPTLENHIFNAPKPWDALDDLMEAIEGDGSQWSYLAASVLRRELREFGASWHGIDWGTHVLLEGDPWKKPSAEDEFPPSHPTTPAGQWKWSAARPQHWAPTVRIEPGQVTVTFYTFTGKAPERIFRHTETYRPGRYRARVEDQLIGQGKGGFLF